jgi:LacI family transcriptional regulator
MSRQKTIKDIAKALDLSPSTVSRALRNHPKINEETKQKVRKLAEEWDYRPNEIALSLKNQRTRTIGVIIPEIVHFFFSTVISGIEEVAYAKGYTVMFCQSNESNKKERLDIKALIAHRVDGLLVSHSRETVDFQHFKDIIKSDLPIVFFDRVPDVEQTSKVVIDDFEAAKKGVVHLIEQGCRRIAHLAGPKHLNIAKQRKAGYLDALRIHEIPVDQKSVIECFDASIETGYQGMKKLLNLPIRPDGLFANNDILAVGAMKAIKEAGLRIPADVAVVGFSNWQFSELVDPPLTTLSQPGISMGREAVSLLIDQIEKPISERTFTNKILDIDLIVRKSSVR